MAKVQSSSIPAHWLVTSFPEVVYFQEGPGIRHWQYRDQGVPFVNIRCIVDGRLDIASMNCLDPAEVASKYEHFLLDAGDYVVSSSGTIGRIGEVVNDDLPCMLNTSVIRMRPRNDAVLDRGFLRYFLSSHLFQHQIETVAAGSVQLNYGPTHLQQMWIALPPLPEQRAIAHILGALDDKIDLNRRMNGTLEEMARALYKSWFVDFDPVRTKMDGHWRKGEALPGLPAELYDLFPDRLVPSELGEIPEGWEVKTLDEIADFRNGLALQNFRPAENEERLPVVKIAQLRTGKADGNEWARANITQDCIINDGDVVFSWSGSLLVKTWCGGPAALNQHLFKVTSGQYPKWLYLHCTKSHLWAFQAIAAGKTTTMGHIKREHLKEAKCVVPDATLLSAVNGIFARLFSKSVSTNVESQALAVLRDSLLPKLINGDLHLSAQAKSMGSRGEDGQH